MIRRLIAAAVFMSAAALAQSLAQARPVAQLMAGDPSGRNVTFLFDAQSGVDGLRVETHRVGNPGAKLSIWIDHARDRLFSRILTTDDCKFGDDGARRRLIFPEAAPTIGVSSLPSGAENGPYRSPERGRDADEHGFAVRP